MHRDIKPENILVSPLGHMTISDFGLSWTSADRDICFDALKAHECVGTPGYIAPEMFSEQVEVYGYDCFVDIFSLGLVFLELFARLKEPFWNARTQLEQLEMMRNKSLCLDHLVDDRNAMDLLCRVSIFPQCRISQAKFMWQMLEFNPDSRAGLEELRVHAYFRGIDWNSVHERRVMRE